MCLSTHIHRTPKEDWNGALYLNFALCSYISQALNLLVKTRVINVLRSASHTHTHTHNTHTRTHLCERRFIKQCIIVIRARALCPVAVPGWAEAVIKFKLSNIFCWCCSSSGWKLCRFTFRFLVLQCLLMKSCTEAQMKRSHNSCLPECCQQSQLGRRWRTLLPDWKKGETFFFFKFFLENSTFRFSLLPHPFLVCSPHYVLPHQ